MATIRFKGKVENVRNSDRTIAYQFIRVPTLTPKHCDMPAFRQHPKFGMLANSEFFLGILSRIRSDIVGNGLGLRLDRMPPNVAVDTSAFMATVAIEV